MRANVLPALRDRLGHEATLGLLELFESERAAWSEHVLSVAVERFERRLAEEISGLRLAVVREIHDSRVEIIKWSFLFWISQLGAFAGLMALMLRVTAR